MARLDAAGLAYLCFLDDCDGFVGRLITRDRRQYSIQGHPHDCGCDHQAEVDQHTCCFDESAQMMDLTISQLDDLSDDIVIPHVMKSGGDNCSLTSQSIEFVTDELVVGEKAVTMAASYVSPQFAGISCLVCVGQMTIKYPPPSS